MNGSAKKACRSLRPRQCPHFKFHSLDLKCKYLSTRGERYVTAANLPIGRLVEADSNGVLSRIGRPPHPSWSLILSDLIRQFQEELTGSDFSIALRGSVARGASVDEAADLDIVVLHDGKLSPITELQSLEIPELSIETSYVNLKELRTDKKWV
tara:strand:+ start:16972 stop:17433 length:462 start_codon:yes stop_codon:yes gene_type:complete